MIFVPAEATVVRLTIYHAKVTFLCYVRYAVVEHPPHL